MSTNDLWMVLSAKLSGEIYQKMRSASEGDGLAAYKAVYSWYTMTSGLGLSQMRQRRMLPTPPKRECDVAQAIESWDRLRSELRDMEGPSSVDLPEAL